VADLPAGEWYATLTDVTPLPPSTILQTNTDYYYQYGCIRIPGAGVIITSPTSPVASTQTLCTSATVANLVATGTAIQWYTTAIGGTALASSTVITSGTYYATQTINGCESPRTVVEVTITPNSTPIFTQVAPICAGATLNPLPTTSNNVIIGTWSPVLNNTTTTAYTFTPNGGQCATSTTMTIVVNPNLTPTFTQVAPICSGTTLTALPTTSNNGVTGTWSPALNNTVTTTYTFTPTAGQCANTTTQTITTTVPVVTSPISFVAPVAGLPSVTIGTQVWTNKNLDVDTYRDGTPIPQVTDPTAWEALTTGAWCYYNNDPANGAIYGKLYNWFAVAGIHDNDPNTPNKILAPLGYHVPSDAEWTILTDYLGGLTVAGGKMKESGNSHWQSPNANATNSTGFTGLPGGYLSSYDGFFNIGYIGFWWSSSQRFIGPLIQNDSWCRWLVGDSGEVTRTFGNLTYFQSVRCIKD
jgi:uncharacterized protein (TIGR02145 family)